MITKSNQYNHHRHHHHFHYDDQFSRPPLPLPPRPQPHLGHVTLLLEVIDFQVIIIILLNHYQGHYDGYRNNDDFAEYGDVKAYGR